MSSFTVQVRRVTVLNHPNADLLEVGLVDGYKVVIPKGKFLTGDLGVYIPEQAIVPDGLIAAMGLEGKLAGPEANRVKAVKLRGELSQGLLYRPDPWPEAWQEGVDLADVLGIYKWEPPIPVGMDGQVEQAPYSEGVFTTYTDIENIKAFPHVLQPGEVVVITEKLHGTCCAISIIDGQRLVASKGIAARSQVLVESESNVYWRAAQNHRIFAKLERYMADNNIDKAVLYGEVLGVQDLKYGFSFAHPGFYAFDLKLPSGFVSHDEFTVFCIDYGIDPATVLYRGPFYIDVLGKQTSGTSTIAKHMREGVVIKPIYEREDDRIGRVILKSISPQYLLRKDGTEAN